MWSVGGIINLPVTASAQLNYGISISGKNNSSTCNISIVPSINAALLGTGKASLAGTINAGVYAKGTFLSTKLTLTAVI